MKLGIIISLCIVFIEQEFFIKIQGKELCSYIAENSTTSTTSCDNDCCTLVAPSIQTACCSHVSLSTLAIPFFVIAGICVLGVCVVYCRPLWKIFLCGHKCPCGNRSRINSPRSVPPNENPIFVINNDGLPDYETITKDSSMKDLTPPPYNFVTTHPNDFGIDSRIPSAPPQYNSRRSSVATTHPDIPIN